MRLTILDLLFPPKCVICQKVLPPGEFICPHCARELSPTAGQSKQHGDFFDVCYSPFFYVAPLRESFLRYKFSGRTVYAPHYARWMADCLTGEDTARFDCITWAPLSTRRRLKRGYDQAQLLALELGKLLSLPVTSTLRKKHRKPLSRLEGKRAIRAGQLLGAYSLKSGINMTGKRILLVDDIITSGATLSECARILKTAGAAEVVCVTLARRQEQ